MRLFTTGVLGLLMFFFMASSQVFHSQTNIITSSNGWVATVTIIPVRVVTLGPGANCTASNSSTITYYNYGIEYQMSVVFSGSNINRSLYIQQYFDCKLGAGNYPHTGAYHYTTNTTHILSATNNARSVNHSSVAWINGANVYSYTVPCYQVTLQNANCGNVYLNYWGNGVDETDRNGGEPEFLTLKIGTSPLPVQLLNFSAEVNSGQVDMNWSTASERNNDYFTIEKTTDGVNYEFVADIKGAGNSSSEKHYTHTDYSPSKGISYYRLKQTDFNGMQELFEPKSVEIFAEINTNVYPNPSTDSKINIVISESGTVVLNLYNLYGQLLKTQMIEAHSGNTTEQIELPETGNTFFVELILNKTLIGRHKVLTTRY